MKKNLKIALISLGCEKNLVDSEHILGMFSQFNFEIIDDLSKANIIIVNTCGFITAAKEEAINTIYDVLQYKSNNTKIVVTGCLVQRYQSDLIKGIPEVDLWVPIRDYDKFGDLLASLFQDNVYCGAKLIDGNRIVSTPKHLAYVKISEGCNNRCSYCAIPLIRGSFVSKKEQSILDEIKNLVASGRKEICLISQDLTRYGSDLENTSLASLLKKICEIKGDYWIRLLYLYPDEITDELIEVIKNNKKILPYFDIPIQHASNKILKWMARRGDKQFIKELVTKIRKTIPEAIIRTTIIVGFPHESTRDFDELIEFIQEVKFDHLGAFMYSKEEDTPSYSMNMQVSQELKEKRYEALMEVSKWVSFSQNQKHIGKILPCIIEEYDEENSYYIGRNYIYAPDDIDGAVIIPKTMELEIGEIYDVKIEEVDFFDMRGQVILVGNNH